MLRLATIAACSIAQRATILDMGLFPDPPVPNEPLDLQVHYSLPEPAVTGGTANQAVTVNYIPLSPSTDDLCTQTQCPIAAGEHNETSRSTFPSGVSGLINSKITWTDQNDDVVWCVQMKQNVAEMNDQEDLDSSSSSSSSGSGSGSSSSSGSGSSSSSGSGSSSSSGSGSSSSSGSGSSTSSGSGNLTSSSGSRGVALRGTSLS